MANIVVGAQWGDEGKGKVVDLLAARSRWVVRFQGGNNAGHTLVVNGDRIVLHLVPSGILQPGCTCVIGNGVVVNPGVLLRELDALSARGIDVGPDRLVLSTEAHLILPWHEALDQEREAALGERRIGTTGRGIGPAYEDKVGRRGLRVGDLYDGLEERLRESGHLEVYGELSRVAERLRPYARPVVRLLNEAADRGEPILLEGAQGTFLDVDHGTYPYVTSSNTTAGAACTGTGIGPTRIDEVLGITKAYCTRVGSGPFPTELTDALGDTLRALGNEYGATTGRPRRCGWLDIPMLRHAARVNGLTALALTKLDVLSGLETVRVAVEYAGTDDFPSGVAALERVVPIFEDLPGWKTGLEGCRRFDELPDACRCYVERVEELVGVRISLLGVGAGREAVIER